MIQQVWCRTALSDSRLPGLRYTLNPYRGCSHNCAYCYVPSFLKMKREEWHEVKARVNIPQVLRKEVKLKIPAVVGLSTTTDPYQPAEKDYLLTRRCIPLLIKRGFSVNIQTKSDLVIRDKDVLGLSENVAVGITITTLDNALCRKLEPGAPAPYRRLEALRLLADAGIYTYVFFGPVIPTLKKEEVPDFVNAMITAGAQEIIVDKLHIKPGVMTNINAALSPDDATMIGQHINNPQYYANILAALKIACSGRIPLQQAFVSPETQF
jgi:DNA repair photolyase